MANDIRMAGVSFLLLFTAIDEAHLINEWMGLEMAQRAKG
jgi:hypothetical protein